MENDSKKITRNRTIVVGVSLLPKHKEFLDEISDRLGCLSVSEAARRAIESFHSKLFPDYIYNKSASDLMKRRAMEIETAKEEMTDRDYINQYCPDGVFGTLKDGREIYLIHAFSNNLELVMVEGAKESFMRDPALITFHKNKLKEGITVDSFFKPNSVRYLENGFKVELSDETKRLFGVKEEES